MSPFSFLKTPALDASQSVDQYSLGQKQALITALKQAALNPVQTPQYGAIASRTSPITPIVQALMGYKAGKDQDALNSQVSGLASQQQAQTLAMMGGAQPQQAQPQPTAQQSPEMQNPLEADPNAAQLAQALAGPQQQPQPVKTSLNPGGLDPKFAAMQYRTLGPEKYSSQYVEPFIKPHTLQSTAHGLNYDSQTGKYYDAGGNLLSADQVKAIFSPQKTEQPLDELSKLNADFKAGRIEKDDYDARKTMMTTRASGAGQAQSADNIEPTAQMIANGALPVPTGRALTTPYGAQLMKRVKEINPDFQGSTYPTQAAAIKSFSSGADSKKVNSLNTALAHMGTIDELAKDLGNGDIKLFNRAANAFAEQTGKPAPTNFKAAAHLVGQEVVAAIVAGGGSAGERDAAQKEFDDANSPEALAGVTKTYRELLGGQFDSLRLKYENGTGRKDFDRFFTDKTKKALKLGAPEAASGWGQATVINK